jgi:hypothetical protein
MKTKHDIRASPPFACCFVGCLWLWVRRDE